MASRSYLTTLTSVANSSSYDFGPQSLGSAASDRVILLAFFARSVAGNALTAVTIGGVTATSIASVNTGSNYGWLYYANVPSGASGDVVVTANGELLRCAAGLWRVVGAGVAPEAVTDTDEDAGATDMLEFSLTTETTGVVLAAAVHQTGGAPAAIGWTGADEDADSDVVEGQIRAGFASTAGGDGMTAITASTTNDNNFCGFAAYFPDVPVEVSAAPSHTFGQSFGHAFTAASF